jgi:hypothetical protein
MPLSNEGRRMTDHHCEGITAYCKPESKVSLGFVEGLNDKIRVMSRRPRHARQSGPGGRRHIALRQPRSAGASASTC